MGAIGARCFYRCSGQDLIFCRITIPLARKIANKEWADLLDNPSPILPGPFYSSLEGDIKAFYLRFISISV